MFVKREIKEYYQQQPKNNNNNHPILPVNGGDEHACAGGRGFLPDTVVVAEQVRQHAVLLGVRRVGSALEGKGQFIEYECIEDETRTTKCTAYPLILSIMQFTKKDELRRNVTIRFSSPTTTFLTLMSRMSLPLGTDR